MFLRVKPVWAELVELENRLNLKMGVGRSTEVGRARHGFPCIDLSAQFGQPFLHEPVGVGAQQQVCRRVTCIDNAKQSLGGFGRIASLVSAVFLPVFAYWIEHHGVVRNRVPGADHRASSPFGADDSRHHCRDFYAEISDLPRQYVDDAFERELAGTVVRNTGQPRVASHRRDVDGVSVALLAHTRQRGFAHGHCSEYIDLELADQFSSIRRTMGSMVPKRLTSRSTDLARVRCRDSKATRSFSRRTVLITWYPACKAAICTGD
ncbi:hypothetical protein SAMN05428978_10558 [Nitrosomonas sp. Nm34]|nr:hypothetical protein SAMN05428978_10558 [Nitrosomonas sp. Nm34]